MFIPKPTESANYDPAPAGTHVGVCYRFVDRGTQMKEYSGERKIRHEVMLSWELGDELMTDGRPFSLSKTYSWSMHEKSTLRKDLESWRGRQFVDEDFEGPNAFNTRKLLGAPCMITVTHRSKGDKIYADVAAIGKLTKGIPAPALVNPRAYLALTEDGWSAEVYAGLSEKVKEIIAGSPEYKELMQRLAKPDEHGDDGAGRFDDDIPF